MKENGFSIDRDILICATQETVFRSTSRTRALRGLVGSRLGDRSTSGRCRSDPILQRGRGERQRRGNRRPLAKIVFTYGYEGRASRSRPAARA